MSTCKTSVKERCSSCKCTIMERPLKREVRPIKDKTDTSKSSTKLKQDCVATIVGVLSLPDSFCSIKGSSTPKPSPDATPVATSRPTARETTINNNNNNDNCQDDCVEVYRDLGECLQKCILRTSKSNCT